MTVDLSCEFLNIKLKNPFLIASVPSVSSWGFPRAAKAGWAGAVLWGSEPMGREKGGWTRGYVPWECSSVGKPPQIWAYENSSWPSEEVNLEQYLDPDRVEKLIRKAKESGIVVGCNIFEGGNPEAWGKVAAAAERGGADFLELNWSCATRPGTGLDIVRDPVKRKAVLKAVRENSRLPKMVKLSAVLGQDVLADVARGAVEDGADAISLTNTFPGLVGIDVETGMPLACELNVKGKWMGVIAGISGPAIKPMGLRAVVEVREAVNVPISGIGGITNWQSAVEYMLAGASTVQVGTAVMLFGYRIVKDMIKGLEDYMERKGYRTINDFVGMTTSKYFGGQEGHRVLAEHDKQPRKMVVNESKCTGCGLCLVACEATLNAGALNIEERVAVINHDLCHRCNSCRIVCPESAITVGWEYLP